MVTAEPKDSATLQDLLTRSANRWGPRIAVEESAEVAITYADLDILSDRVRDTLLARGVRRGDRVGIVLHKSIEAVAAIFGTLKAGAAYVTVDATAPATRAAVILGDCSARVAFTESELAESLNAALRTERAATELLVLDELDGGRGLDPLLAMPAGAGTEVETVGPDDLAYILYTSGSTGRPKGVTLTHRNARTFIDWASNEFDVTENDVFSSHAPFHFDLSIFDLYVCLRHGARLVLIDSKQSREPVGLATLMSERGVTVWYSTPSILTLLLQYGKLDRHEFGALRYVLFAGEVFPVKHLRRFKEKVPGARYFNLYGPTETNVCTFYEIPQSIPADRMEPYPIGHACDSFDARVVDTSGEDVPTGEEGELWVSGPGVMAGYWNQPGQTAMAMATDESGRHWYRTGDVVTEDAVDGFVYRGRRDRMVKRRGYRIELGEIETALYGHPSLAEVAAVAKAGESGVQIKVFVRPAGEAAPSVIELKRFSAEVLPLYMVPDQFVTCAALPKTSTDKIDYRRLAEMA